MVSKSISELPAVGTLAGGELVPLVQGGLTKRSTVAQIAALGAAAPSGSREVLTADRTYYVRTDGSNSNDGLSNTAGGAFLTLNKAWKAVTTGLLLNGHVVTIAIANGTYSSGISTYGDVASAPDSAFNNAYVPIDAGTILISGNDVANVIVQNGVNSDSTCFEFAHPAHANVEIRFITMDIASGSYGAVISGRCNVFMDEVGVKGGSIGGGQHAFFVTNFGLLHLRAVYLENDLQTFAEAERNGFIYSETTLVLTGACTVTDFYTATTGGFIFSDDAHYPLSGLSGRHYNVSRAGSYSFSIDNASTVPGNAEGIVSTGGIVDYEPHKCLLSTPTFSFLSNGAATAHVSSGFHGLFCFSGSASISTLTGGTEGMVISLVVGDNTTIVDTDAPTTNQINLVGTATNYVGNGNERKVLRLQYHYNDYWFEIGRSPG